MSAPAPSFDRLWPDPAFGIGLDELMDGFEPPAPRTERPAVALNMVTSIDGRAQLAGAAEGLASRADRILMRHYRAAFDAVLSGSGTLRQAGVWLRVGDALAERRRAAGRTPNPIGVVVAGTREVPLDAAWFSGDESRVLVVGAGNPIDAVPRGTELLRAPDARPSVRWLLARLAERGIRSVLVEGGPTLNAAFVAERGLDELYWTIGSHVLGSPALPMVAPVVATAAEPWPARLLAVVRHADELMLRYRLESGG